MAGVVLLSLKLLLSLTECYSTLSHGPEDLVSPRRLWEVWGLSINFSMRTAAECKPICCGLIMRGCLQDFQRVMERLSEVAVLEH